MSCTCMFGPATLDVTTSCLLGVAGHKFVDTPLSRVVPPRAQIASTVMLTFMLVAGYFVQNIYVWIAWLKCVLPWWRLTAFGPTPILRRRALIRHQACV